MRKYGKTTAACLLAGMLLVSGVTVTGCGGDSMSKQEYRMAGIEALQAGSYEEAVQQFDEAIAHSNGLVGNFELDVLKYRAEAEYQMGDYESAAETYRILSEVDEEKPEYYYFLCIAQTAAGELDEANESFQKGNALNSDGAGNKEARLALCTALIEQGQYENAMTLFETAVIAGQASPQMYNQMGLCYLGEEDYEAALAAFNDGLAAADRSADESAAENGASIRQQLLFNRAVTYEYSGEFSKARELMEQYVAAYADDEGAKRELEFLKTR